MLGLVGIHSLVVSSLLAAVAPSPYAGEQSRAIKALSQEQVTELLEGKGMGFAKAAELNGYPGPRHVMDFAEELALSPAQAEQVQRIFVAMQTRAIEVGKTLVDEERQLDRLFNDRRAAAETLSAVLAKIGTLQGELRRVHLQAHIDTTALLSHEQVGQYVRLRGYDSSSGESAPEHRHGERMPQQSK